MVAAMVNSRILGFVIVVTIYSSHKSLIVVNHGQPQSMVDNHDSDDQSWLQVSIGQT